MSANVATRQATKARVRDPPPPPPKFKKPGKKLVSDAERTRVRSGIMTDFCGLCVFLVAPQQGQSPWKNIHLDALKSIPKELLGVLTPELRKRRFLLHLVDQDNPIEVMVFSRLETGVSAQFAKTRMNEEPRAYYEDLMESDPGMSPIGAYEATVDAYNEGLFDGRSYCRVKGYYRKVILTGKNDGDITGPTDSDLEVSFRERIEVEAEVHREDIPTEFSLPSAEVNLEEYNADNELFSQFAETTVDLNVDTAARSTKNSQKSLPPQEQPGSAREESQDTPSNPPAGGSGGQNPGGSGTGGGGGGKKGDDDKKKTPEGKDDAEDDPEVEEEPVDPDASTESHTGVDEVVDDPEDTDYNPDETEGTPSKKRRRNDELPDPNQAMIVTPPGGARLLILDTPKSATSASTSRSAALEEVTSESDAATPGKRAPPKAPTPLPQTSRNTEDTPPEPATQRLGKKSDAQKKMTASRKRKLDYDTDESMTAAMNAHIRCKRCGDTCNCSKLTVTQLQDSAAGPSEHRQMMLAARFHNSNVAGHRATRSLVDDLGERMEALEVMCEKILDHVDFLSMRKTASAVYGHDSEMIRIPWGDMDAVAYGMQSLPYLEAIERLMTTDIVSDNVQHFVKDVIEAFFTPDMQGRAQLGLQQRQTKTDRIFHWGYEFFVLPPKFGEIMKRVLRRKYRLRSETARDKVNGGFQEARTRAKCRLRNIVLQRRREPGCHPLWELILQTEMMRQSKFRDLIDSPAPYDRGPEEMTRYMNIYKEEVEESYAEYKRLLEEDDKTEEGEFLQIVMFAHNRGLAPHLPHPFDPTEPLPPAEEKQAGPTQLSQVEMAKKGKGKSKGKKTRGQKVKSSKTVVETDEADDEGAI